jgi:NADH:ubiquinone oxidoreductase subunit F (NADH-binding)
MSAAAVEETTSRRLLAGVRRDGRAVTLAEHRRAYGTLEVDTRTILETIQASGLRGRGGGGFPTALKMNAVRDSGGRAIVVANGCEGEPVSGKDKTLLAYVPHLVLDGAVVAARAVRARDAIVAVPQFLHGVVERAIAERNDGRISLQAVAVPDTFVAGEETALVQFLNGGPALPTFTPPRPFERGVRGLPTLVQNVETLAHLALIARYGPRWFRSVGTAEEPGSTLVTLSGAVQHAGVYEIPLGRSLASLLEAAGGLRGEPAAYLIGGYFGTWLPAESVVDLVLADADLARHGAALGARAIVVLPEGECGVRETARIARYLSDQSARQCGPCLHGLDAVATDLEQLLDRTRRVDGPRLERRLQVIEGRGACRHPDGAVRLVASALRVFASDVQRHLGGNRCEAARR